MTQPQIPDDLPALPEKSYLGDDASYGYDDHDMHAYAREAVRAALSRLSAGAEPVAEVESWTNGSYSRNYRVRWLRDVEAGTKLYTAAPAQSVPAGWLQALGELVCAAKDRDASRADHDRAINAAHEKLFNLLSAAPPAPAQAGPTDAEMLDAAITLLAEWVNDIDRNGTGWDDWDENYKNAAYRPGPLRNLIDEKLRAIRATKEQP